MTNLTNIQRIYFLGIGGIGMSALARYFNHYKIKVAGYDKTETVLTKELVKEGIEIHYSEDVELVKKHLVHKIKILPDKRSFVISATAEGRITAVEAHTAIIQTDKKFFSPEPLASIYKLLLPHKN